VKHVSPTGLVLTVLAAALWGLSPVATKGALAGYSPEMICVVRLTLAALFFRVLSGPRPWHFKEREVWIAGVALGADFLFYNYGVRLTTATAAGLVINIEMVATVLFAVRVFGERLTYGRVAGCVVTFLGVLYVTLQGANLHEIARESCLFGNILVILAGLAWSLFAAAQKRVVPRRSLFEVLAPIFAIADLTAAPVLLRPGALAVHADFRATLMLVALCALCTVLVYYVYAQCQRLVELSVLAVVLCLIPIFAVAFSVLLLGEPITGGVLLGGAVIIAGIVLISVEAAPRTLARGEAAAAASPPAGAQ
jgi:drug/metabolite transporter (DMT)-like permease